MANMREERKIVITLNPEQLRAMADKMDQLYPKLKIGDSTFVDFLGLSENLKVCLHLDQMYYHNKKRGKYQTTV